MLISNADLDFVIITDGTLLAIQNMTWNGRLGFQTAPSEPIVVTLPDLEYGSLFQDQFGEQLEDPQGTMGIQHFERGLMWGSDILEWAYAAAIPAAHELPPFAMVVGTY